MIGVAVKMRYEKCIYSVYRWGMDTDLRYRDESAAIQEAQRDEGGHVVRLTISGTYRSRQVVYPVRGEIIQLA